MSRPRKPPLEKVCVVCNAAFIVSGHARHQRKTCSIQCSHQRRAAMAALLRTRTSRDPIKYAHKLEWLKARYRQFRARRTCHLCGASLNDFHARKAYCTDKCASEAQRVRERERSKLRRKGPAPCCVVCKGPLTHRNWNARLCSNECFVKHRRQLALERHRLRNHHAELWRDYQADRKQRLADIKQQGKAP